MARRTILLLATLLLSVLAASSAEAETSKSSACVGKPYSYAGLQSETKAHGVAATLSPIAAPAVADGHVGGWIGVGGANVGPGGVTEWLQAGFASFDHEQRSRMYYEVTLPGAAPKYVELSESIEPGEAHHFSVLEMGSRKSWWRVWVDHKPVSPPIHLPGSHGTFFPQAIAENWNGGTGTCNAYSYSFSDITLAQTSGGKWRPLTASSVLQDAGYKVVRSSAAARTFVATSL